MHAILSGGSNSDSDSGSDAPKERSRARSPSPRVHRPSTITIDLVSGRPAERGAAEPAKGAVQRLGQAFSIELSEENHETANLRSLICDAWFVDRDPEPAAVMYRPQELWLLLPPLFAAI